MDLVIGQPLQVNQRNGCSPVLLVSPTKLSGELSQGVTHLHPLSSNPATDTRVSLTICNGPKPWCLEADLRDTVNELKKRIVQERKCGDSGSIRLLYKNQELIGPQTLGQQNVKNVATLLIVHRCNGG